jgi:hypothetical protein
MRATIDDALGSRGRLLTEAKLPAADGDQELLDAWNRVLAALELLKKNWDSFEQTKAIKDDSYHEVLAAQSGVTLAYVMATTFEDSMVAILARRRRLAFHQDDPSPPGADRRDEE